MENYITDDDKKERKRAYDRERYLRLRKPPVFPTPLRNQINRPAKYNKKPKPVEEVKLIYIHPENDHRGSNHTRKKRYRNVPANIYGDKFEALSNKLTRANAG